MREGPAERGLAVDGHASGQVGTGVEPSRRGPRFIFYANELIGLGQLRRTLALAARLSDSRLRPELADPHRLADRARPSSCRRGSTR